MLARLLAGRIIFVCTSLLAFCGAGVAETCFNNENLPKFEVMQNAPPPAEDAQPGYRYYPATAFLSMNLSSLIASKATAKKYYWQWANHGPRRVAKGNLGPYVPSQASPTKLFFASPEAANACTLAQTAAVLGFNDLVPQYAHRGAISILDAAPPPGDLQDVCPIFRQRLPVEAKGVLLDYEVQDGRTPKQTLEFLLEYAALVHRANKQAILYTNPLDAPTQELTGVDASNAGQLNDAYDAMSIFAWSRNRQQNLEASLDSQLQILGERNLHKVYVTYELNGTSLDDAALVRALIFKNNLLGVLFWRNLATPGGACSSAPNRKISCLVHGTCSP
jgi:hypothetical protein